MRKLLCAILFGVSLASLAGCVVYLPPDEPPQASAGECREEETLLGDAGRDYVLPNGCELVRIEGQDITVTGPDVGRIEIRGDRIRVTVEDLGGLAIAGQDNEIETASLGPLQISGDRNSVAANGYIESAVINGNDNLIATSDDIGTVNDHGDRNRIAIP